MVQFRIVDPIPCWHIWQYYNAQWEANHCLAWQLLRRGYRQWACGIIEFPHNNLY